jgi:hypothetical protein
MLTDPGVRNQDDPGSLADPRIFVKADSPHGASAQCSSARNRSPACALRPLLRVVVEVSSELACQEARQGCFYAE